MLKHLKILSIMFLAAMLILLIFSCRTDDTDYYYITDNLKRSELDIIYDQDTVTVDGVTWEILEAEDRGALLKNQYGGELETIEGRFIYLAFTIENNSDVEKALYDLRIVDDKGRVYTIANEAYGYMDSTTAGPRTVGGLALVPDEKREFNAVFDVPVDAVDLLIECTDLGFPPAEKVYIDLGV